MSKLKFSVVEKYLFLLLMVFNLIPVLTGKFFPTLDGPAHLHNSQLINSLLLENRSVISDFFKFNAEPVPNWTGHLILSFFNLFLPAFVAEKILLVSCLIGLPLSFRLLIKNISPGNPAFSYLIFPFTYSFLFILGFYNFSIALILLLLTLVFWIKKENSIFNPKNILQLFALVTLTYFSHIFVFAILLFLIGLHILISSLLQIDNHSRKDILKSFYKKAGSLFISSFLSLILFAFYFLSRTYPKNNEFLPKSELIENLKNISSIIALNFEYEVTYTKKIYYIIVFLLIIAVYNKINSIISGSTLSLKNSLTLVRKGVGQTDYWLIAAFFFLFLYFQLPNSNGAAGFVSLRLNFLFFLFLIIWISTQHFAKWVGFAVAIISIYYTINLTQYYTKATKDLKQIAKECNDISSHIPANSIVLPLNYSNNWLTAHLSNYLGVDKPLIILENYECGNDYFPLRWNFESMPTPVLGKTEIGSLQCTEWNHYTRERQIKIDYVLLLNDSEENQDSCTLEIKQILNETYQLTYQSKNFKLYHYQN